MMSTMMQLSVASRARADALDAPGGYLHQVGIRECGLPDGTPRPAIIDRDWELVDALRRRDPLAAERLVTTYGERAYRLAVRIAANARDAEEAVQDAFWSVVRKVDTFRGDSSFGSWVYRIVSNAAYRKVRRRPQGVVEISLDEVLPSFDADGRHASAIRDWSATIDDPAVRTELRAVLDSAVWKLPAQYRVVFVLRDIEGLSMAEVADAMGITVTAAKVRVHRARLLLRKNLSTFMDSASTSVEGLAHEQDLEGRAAALTGVQLSSATVV